MEVVNYRARFANNSSSSHSVCFSSPELKREVNAMVSPFGRIEPNDYGWDTFRLNSPSEKINYLMHGVMATIHSIIDPLPLDVHGRIVLMKHYARNLFGVEWELTPGSSWRGRREVDMGGYIDHQSAFRFPLARMENRFNMVHAGYACDLIDSIANDASCVIFGGNDNDDGSSYDRVEENPRNYPTDALDRGGMMCRGEWEHCYTLFNPSNGDRVTVDFSKDLGKEPKKLSKLMAPLLVDMKITDFCPYRCGFCYQGSTKEGAHGKYDDICIALEKLAEMGVFEIAFGGGEPTQHPFFSKIIQHCYDLGMQPNFTTFNLDWMKDEKLAALVKKLGCSFAVSNPSDIGELVEVLRKGFEVTAQFIEHTFVHFLAKAAEGSDSYLQAIKHHGIPVTILGYKTSGRGGSYKGFEKCEWEPEVMEHIHQVLGKFAVDTCFIRNNPGYAKQFGWDSATFSTQEGYGSWYIDMVKGQHGPSSYEVDKLTPFPDNHQWQKGIDYHDTNFDFEWMRVIPTV